MAGLAIVLPGCTARPPYPPPQAAPAEQLRLRAWLGAHGEFRTATDEDCRCADDILRVRRGGTGWPPEPDYHPYSAHGDFNGDGKPDAAVGVISASAPRAFRTLIFDGASTVAFLSGPSPLGMGLFFGDPRAEPHRLLVGPFESEACSFEPDGVGGYRVDCSEWDAAGT